MLAGLEIHSAKESTMIDLFDIEKIATAQQLQEVVEKYNWSDGFEIPIVISNHQKCDIAVALSLFWLSDAICWFTGGVRPSEHNKSWVEFCILLTNRILSGYYKSGSGVFLSGLSASQIYRYRKQGVPEIFLSDISSQEG